MAKNNSNNNVMYGVLGLAVLLGAGTYFGFIDSEWYRVSEENPLCDIRPSAKDCSCLEGQEKLYGGSNKYFCEKIDKMIDIDSNGWEETAITIFKQKISNAFPDCDSQSVECNAQASSWITATAIANNNDRKAYVLCDVSGYTLSEGFLDVEYGSLTGGFCADYNDIVEDATATESATFVFPSGTNKLSTDNRTVAIGKGFRDGVFSSKCGDVDNGVAMFNVESPHGHIREWTINNRYGSSTSTYCSITSFDSNHVEGECRRSCPGSEIYYHEVTITGYYEQEFIDSFGFSYCIDVTNDKYIFDSRVRCHEYMSGYGHDCDNTYVCMNDGSWMRSRGCGSTPTFISNNDCPSGIVLDYDGTPFTTTPVIDTQG